MSEVRLLWTNVSAMTTSDLTRALSLVSDERAEKAKRFRNESDRKLSVCAELLLQKALGKNEISFTYGEKEKPYIEGGPYFNISHSGDIVICAVAEKEAGCDIEKIKDYNEKIVRRFFTENEGNWIEDQSDKTEAFFRIWTLKEAFVKATGLGLSLDFRDFSIEMKGKIHIVDYNGIYSFQEIELCEGYRCAVCTAYEETEVKTENITISELIRRQL